MSSSPPVSPLKGIAGLVLTLALCALFVARTLDLAVEEGIGGMRLHLLILTAPMVACVFVLAFLSAVAVARRWAQPSVRLGRIRGLDQRGVVLRLRSPQVVALLVAAALGVALYCGALSVACLRGPVPDSTIPGQRRAAFVLALVLAVVSTGYLLLCAIDLALGRLGRSCVALTPEGVHVRYAAARLHVPWAVVEAVMAGDRGAVLVVAPEKARWRRTSWLVPFRITADAGWTFREVPASAPLVEALQRYHADPDLRSELDDERGVDRVRAAAATAATNP